MNEKIPDFQKALVLESFDEKIPKLKRIPTSQPSSGQLLIKVLSTTINHQDLQFIKGIHQQKAQLPTIPGLEGSGIVVQSGGGLKSWSLLGKSVAFLANDQMQGAWQQYIVTDPAKCLTLDHGFSAENSGCSLINPLTALGLLEKIKQDGHLAIIQSSGCSSISKMIYRLFQKNKIPVLNLVQTKEQEEILREEGIGLIINCQEEHFGTGLKKICKDLAVTGFIDSIGGELTHIVFKNMPRGSVCYQYGFQETLSQFDSQDLIFKSKQIKGFWLNEWLNSKGSWAKSMMMQNLRYLLKDSLKTKIVQEFALEDFSSAKEFYEKNWNRGKILLKPFQESKRKNEKGSILNIFKGIFTNVESVETEEKQSPGINWISWGKTRKEGEKKSINWKEKTKELLERRKKQINAKPNQEQQQEKENEQIQEQLDTIKVIQGEAQNLSSTKLTEEKVLENLNGQNASIYNDDKQEKKNEKQIR